MFRTIVYVSIFFYSALFYAASCSAYRDYGALNLAGSHERGREKTASIITQLGDSVSWVVVADRDEHEDDDEGDDRGDAKSSHNGHDKEDRESEDDDHEGGHEKKRDKHGDHDKKGHGDRHGHEEDDD